MNTIDPTIARTNRAIEAKLLCLGEAHQQEVREFTVKLDRPDIYALAHHAKDAIRLAALSLVIDDICDRLRDAEDDAELARELRMIRRHHMNVLTGVHPSPPERVEAAQRIMRTIESAS